MALDNTMLRELRGRVLAGDERALVTILDSYSGVAERYARRMGLDDSEHIQEINIRIWQLFTGVDWDRLEKPIKNPNSYIHTLIINYCRDKGRRQGYRRRFHGAVIDSDVRTGIITEEGLHRDKAPEYSIFSESERAVWSGRLKNVMDIVMNGVLSTNERPAMLLRLWGYTLDEGAQAMGVSSSTFKTHFYRARKKVNSAYRRMYGEPIVPETDTVHEARPGSL
jgi:RNA polymerase sigma factor (sigma-70 family)